MSSPVGIRVAVAAEFADGHFFPTVFGSSFVFDATPDASSRVAMCNVVCYYGQGFRISCSQFILRLEP